MCQIIFKPAGVNIDKRLIESTCIVNRDGFGVMFFDEGSRELFAEKQWNGDNKVDEIYPIIEGLADQDAFFHFRYRTKGEISSEACHPFKVFDGDNRSVYLMHNGTLSDFGSTTTVDSEEFGREIVGPLYGKYLDAGISSPLEDPLYQRILSKFIGLDSKIVLLDSAGKNFIFNRSKGTDYEGEDLSGNKAKFWVSNTYSFNQSHREPTTTTWYNGGGYYVNGTWHRGPKPPTQTNQTTGGSQTGVTPFQDSRGSQNGKTTSTPSQGLQRGTRTGQSSTSVSGGTSTSKEVKEVPILPKRSVVPSYYELAGFDEIDDLRSMTLSDISELVDLEPENAKLLINDLLIALFEDGND